MGIEDREILYNILLLQLVGSDAQVYVPEGQTLAQAIYGNPASAYPTKMTTALNILHCLNHNCVHFIPEENNETIQTLHWCEQLVCNVLL